MHSFGQQFCYPPGTPQYLTHTTLQLLLLGNPNTLVTDEGNKTFERMFQLLSSENKFTSSWKRVLFVIPSHHHHHHLVKQQCNVFRSLWNFVEFAQFRRF